MTRESTLAARVPGVAQVDRKLRAMEKRYDAAAAQGPEPLKALIEAHNLLMALRADLIDKHGKASENRDPWKSV